MNSLEELRAIGAFVNGAPVARTIKFKIDDVEYDATIHVRRQSLGAQERMWARSNANPKDDPHFAAIMISTLISLGEHGEESLTTDEAYALHPALGRAMLDAIEEVNGSPAKN